MFAAVKAQEQNQLRFLPRSHGASCSIEEQAGCQHQFSHFQKSYKYGGKDSFTSSSSVFNSLDIYKIPDVSTIHRLDLDLNRETTF